ncbi:MAG: nucleotidyltransferase family protein [Rhodobacteraceae bacterium]|nr:nucleotidyltransferase family protein [Paracoccaceae bacterium]
MQRPEAVMLFAAGFGTRMGALTATRPKPLVPVAGRALIDHALDIVDTAGLKRIVANAHYRADMIAAHLAPRGIAISHETPDILDTGGGLRAALPMLGAGPVVAINTDAVWRGPNPLRALLDEWNPHEMDALLLCVPPARARGHAGTGDFHLAPDGRLNRGGDLIYTGAQILRTERLADIADPAFSLNRVWDAMAADGRLFGTVWPGTWCDVGTPEGIALAERMLADV